MDSSQNFLAFLAAFVAICLLAGLAWHFVKTQRKLKKESDQLLSARVAYLEDLQKRSYDRSGEQTAAAVPTNAEGQNLATLDKLAKYPLPENLTKLQASLLAKRFPLPVVRMMAQQLHDSLRREQDARAAIDDYNKLRDFVLRQDPQIVREYDQHFLNNLKRPSSPEERFGFSPSVPFTASMLQNLPS
jgi:hypothetical protein